ncbi:hypothetical protein [Archangium sp. Cb G35]|uniref:hypothetical protein n=1 Tax=Archangium sp. Cb G35 TaxID=1920190 RepID=UPI000A51FC04|nr:hypothetical protein [Archangium sp. Cb G35]
MKAWHVVLALAAVGLPAAAYASTRQASAAAPPPPLPPPVAPPEPSPVGFAAAEPDGSPVGELAPPEPPRTGGDLISDAAKLLGGGAGAMIDLGLKSLELQEHIVGALGANEATQDAVRVFGHVASVGFVAQQGLEKLAEAVGIDKELGKDIGQVGGIAAAAGLVFGAPVVGAVAAVKGAAELASAAIGAIAGEETEKAVRGAVSELDPFKTGSLANQVIGGIGDAIFGERPKAPPPPPPLLTEEQLEARRKAEVEAAKALAEQEKQKAKVIAKKPTGKKLPSDSLQDW